MTWLPAAETKNVAARGEVRARGPVAGGEDLGDLGGHRQPAAAVSLRPDDVDVPVIEVDVPGLQGAGLTGPQPAGVHQREERDRLPPPRGLGLAVPLPL